MRVLRAVYNRARREHPDLPPNPCENVDFHGVRRRTVDLAPERLRTWGQAVLGLKPVRRDLQLFMMLTGMRRTNVSFTASAWREFLWFRVKKRTHGASEPEGQLRRIADFPRVRHRRRLRRPWTTVHAHYDHTDSLWCGIRYRRTRCLTAGSATEIAFASGDFARIANKHRTAAICWVRWDPCR
jgi:hypothetical protein